ncbi:hypothetical protein N7457_006836 [Penicillium paradoxum]|uniref:uncharacterized protein n=1 Tax=Penicillium paradoxum TaxID=176176 RepID=UPI00254793B5|nr:uncharacterized protein N7457_006836 [Penicillium paradoxum]KAJ5779116.1 hypothetical protein N7457_006836 [Penicillium paradoxum]
MQSFLQHRQIRQEVEEALAYGQGKSFSSRSSTSSPSLEAITNGNKDLEAGLEKPALAADGPFVPGVTVSHLDGPNGDIVFVVGWRDNDPSNSLNWSLLKKWIVMMMCYVIAIAMTVPSSVEGAT